MDQTTSSLPSDFIRDIIDEDMKTGKHQGRVATRFPPEPNGYPHIGHAKSVCLNFGIAAQYGGTCNLRLDDTDPSGESMEYVESIIRDVKWLGFDWQDRLYYASDYYEKLYQYALALIREGKAYVCDLSADEIREYRGTLTQPGKESPYRNRSVEENLDLFERMRAGEFADGTRVLRAKNRHDLSQCHDARSDHVPDQEGEPLPDGRCVVHLSDVRLCPLPLRLHRGDHPFDLHPGVREQPAPVRLVSGPAGRGTPSAADRVCPPEPQLHGDEQAQAHGAGGEGVVSGWDDPQMPTLSGMRRRGFTPEAIRSFCEKIGVSKNDSLIDMALLENCVRDDLNEKAPRVMAVLRPLRVVIDNYPEGRVEEFDCPYHPKNADMGSRKVPFSRELYHRAGRLSWRIPPKKFFRLAPGREVRLRYGYFIKCVERRERSGYGRSRGSPLHL